MLGNVHLLEHVCVIFILSGIGVAAKCGRANSNCKYVTAECVMVTNPNRPQTEPITGRVDLSQLITPDHEPCGPLHIALQAYNVPGNEHGVQGFHIHETSNFTNGCDSLGGHYNPLQSTHGGPFDPFDRTAPRHVGDLGNVRNDWGSIRAIMETEPAGLFGDYSIMGRSMISKNLELMANTISVEQIHSNPDDLGRGGNDESLRTGNAGARLACCTIQMT